LIGAQKQWQRGFIAETVRKSVLHAIREKPARKTPIDIIRACDQGLAGPFCILRANLGS